MRTSSARPFRDRATIPTQKVAERAESDQTTHYSVVTERNASLVTKRRGLWAGAVVPGAASVEQRMGDVMGKRVYGH